jgi:hypothetical protein
MMGFPTRLHAGKCHRFVIEVYENGFVAWGNVAELPIEGEKFADSSSGLTFLKVMKQIYTAGNLNHANEFDFEYVERKGVST